MLEVLAILSVILLALMLININEHITLTPGCSVASPFFYPTAGKDVTLPRRSQKSGQILPASDLLVRAILIIEDVVNI